MFIVAWFFCNKASAIQYSVESQVKSRIENNSNIFLTSLPHDDVTSLIISSEVNFRIREKNWESRIEARFLSNTYSNQDLDSFDKYFDIVESYQSEKNIFGLNGNYNLDSSLNNESTNFGITSRRVKSKKWSLSPQYTRLINEQLHLSASYRHKDVGFIDDLNTGFVPYRTNRESTSILYALSERNRLSASLQAEQYESKDGTAEYNYYVTRLGVTHQFTERLSGSISAGRSRNKTTNRSTQTFDFVGTMITRNIEIDFRSNNLVLETSLEQSFDNGSFTGSFSRSNTTSSVGGLNQSDNLSIKYVHYYSQLWKLKVNARFQNINAISSGTSVSDRKLLLFQPVMSYTIDRDITISASYRHIQRQFKNQSDNTQLSSNTVFFNLTYRFPELSTF